MSVDPSVVKIDLSRDKFFDKFGLETLKERYMVGEEKSPQEAFARACAAFADDANHAQRLYDYVSNFWFMFATPVLANGGTTRGLPISCLTGDSYVNTYSGAKKMIDIVVGDKVLTHKGRWREVLAKTSRMSSGDLYELRVSSRLTPTKITGNHPVLTNMGWIRVDQLDAEKHLIAVNRSVEYKEQSYVFETNQEDIEENTKFKRNKLKPNVEVTEDLAWALGLWFAEGSHLKIKKDTYSSLRITLDVAEEELAIKWLKIMKESFGVEGKIYKNERKNSKNEEKTDRWLNAYVCSYELSNIFSDSFGVGCKVKTLPEWILNLPNTTIKAFLEGFVAGDGCQLSNRNTITITNPALMFGIYNICLKLGYDVSASVIKKFYKGEVRMNGQLIILDYGISKRRAGIRSGIKFNDGLTYCPIASIVKLEQDEEVFDIQVEEDESFSVSGFVVHNCFLNNVPDSRQGILDNFVENAWLASMGGGIGTYWGNLRSVGTKTSKGSKTSGVIAFTKCVDSQMMAWHQGGTRRGAAAVYLDISHPEVEEWIFMRKPTGGDANRRALNLHNAINITDDFMEAVEKGLPWNLIDPYSKTITKTVDARHLWREIINTRVELGEPYIFFKDTANRALPQPLKDIGLEITHSNLCTEIMLPTGIDPRNGKMRTAVCCLSSVNAEKFEEWESNEKFIPDLMRMLDNILQNYIDSAPETHKAAVYSATMERSVGLGLLGFHSFLQRKMIPFGSDAARAWNIHIFRHLDKETKYVSLVLGSERGEAPDMKGTGHRFAHRMAVAPNASSSILAGNTSPSIEPVPANAFQQKTLSGLHVLKNRYLINLLETKGMNTDEVWKSINTAKGSVQHLDFLSQYEKDVFKTAIEIDQMDIIRLASDRAGYIDQAQSVNVFFPSDARAPELHEVHMAAWKGGVKSLYYLRSEALKRADLVALNKNRVDLKIDNTNDNTEGYQMRESDCVACEG